MIRRMPKVAELVATHASLLYGAKRESEESLEKVEAELGVLLPPEVRWLLLECGYGPVHAVSNIRQSVGETHRFRNAVALPHQYVVLEDRDDAGAVLLDTNSSQGRVLWIDTHALHRVKTGKLTAGEADEFNTFSEWVQYCITEALDEPDA